MEIRCCKCGKLLFKMTLKEGQKLPEKTVRKIQCQCPRCKQQNEIEA